MPDNRFFYPELMTQGASICLTEKEHHHLAHVMRISVGEQIELVNGKGQLATARVEAVDRHQAHLNITRVHTEACVTEPRLILAQALPRLNRLETIIEKGVELGVDAFWLFPAQGSEKDTLTQSQLDRLHLIAVSAMKQCGRLDLPSFQLLPSLDKWHKTEGILLFGDTRPSAQPLQHASLSEKITFFVGPEKGWHPSEITLLETHLLAQGVKLHPNTLRVDTAALVALTLCKQIF